MASSSVQLCRQTSLLNTGAVITQYRACMHYSAALLPLLQLLLTKSDTCNAICSAFTAHLMHSVQPTHTNTVPCWPAPPPHTRRRARSATQGPGSTRGTQLLLPPSSEGLKHAMQQQQQRQQ